MNIPPIHIHYISMLHPRLRYFLAVAETRHFGRAAERLGIKQPPLSQQIRLLEGQLGLRLFTRSTRRVELTEAGGILLDAVKRADAQIEEAVTHARRIEAGEAGLLRVGFVSTTASGLLSRVLRAFRERYPQAKLELFHLTSAQQAAAFESRSIDVGFLRAPPAGDIEIEVIAREPLWVALPEQHRLAGRKSLVVSLLKREAFVMWDRQQTAGIAQTILGLCARHGFQPSIALEVTNPPAMLSLIAGGVGIGIVPASAMRLRPDGVVFRALRDKHADSPVALAWRRDDTPALLPRFVELVREVCRRSAEAPAER